MLNILPSPKLHTLAVYKFLFELKSCIAPESVKNMFVFNSDVHSHVTRQSSNLHVESVTSEVRLRNIRHQAAQLHNCGDDITYDVSYVTFKYLIRSVLLFT